MNTKYKLRSKLGKSINISNFHKTIDQCSNKMKQTKNYKNNLLLMYVNSLGQTNITGSIAISPFQEAWISIQYGTLICNSYGYK